MHLESVDLPPGEDHNYLIYIKS